MPWKPSYEATPPVPSRLAAYAGRVTEMLKDGRPAGFLMVELTTYWESVGGALWWRRFWELEWTAQVWLSFHGAGRGVDCSDQIIPPEVVGEALDDWDAGRFEVGSQVVKLRWLDGDEAAQVAGAEFNKDSLDWHSNRG